MVKIMFDLDDAPSAPKTEETVQNPLLLTEKAANRILFIMQKKNETGLSLRLSVQGGGCSGYSYNFKLTKDKKDSDLVISNSEVAGVEVVIDPISFNYLKGSTVDFEESLEMSQFVVNNPNAKSSCGCGTSFSL